MPAFSKDEMGTSPATSKIIATGLPALPGHDVLEVYDLVYYWADDSSYSQSSTAIDRAYEGLKAEVARRHPQANAILGVREGSLGLAPGSLSKVTCIWYGTPARLVKVE